MTDHYSNDDCDHSDSDNKQIIDIAIVEMIEEWKNIKECVLNDYSKNISNNAVK